MASPLESAVAAVRRRLIPFLFLLYIFAYLDRINIGFAALQMNAALGLSEAAYGLGAGIFFLGYTAFEIPSNIILARVGARLWIARIMITWGLVSAGMMFVKSAPMFYALRLLLGIAEAGFFPGIIYYLTRWVPAHERARTIAAFMTAVLAAGIIGGPVSGALLSLHGALGLEGWQWLFLLEGLPSVVLGFVVLRVLIDRPDDATWLTEEQRDALVTRLRADAAGTANHARTTLDVFRQPRFWVLAASYFTIPVALYAFSFFLPQILRAAFAGSTFQIGLLSALPYLVGAIVMVITGRHSDRTGERRWHVALAACVSAIGFVASAFARGPAASIVTLSVALAGLASMLGPFWTFATTFADGTGAAAGIAFINSVGNIGGFVGPYLLGYLKDATSSYSSGLILIGFTIAAGGALVLAVKPRDVGETPTHTPFTS